MIKKNVLILVFFILPLLLGAKSNNDTVEGEIYNELKGYFSKNFPQKFTCKVQGKSLKKSLGKIPKDAITDPKNIHILLLFHEQWGTRVLLKGVNEAFEDRFSYIEKVFEFIQPFLNNSNYSEFQKSYEIFDARKGSFKLRKKMSRGAYLNMFSVNGQIVRVQEYKGKELFMTLQIKYRKVKKYLVPSSLKVFFYEKKKLKILNFELKDFDFQPKISEEDFLG